MVDERRTIVVADTSGSMSEHGKLMLVRNLLTHVRQWAREADGALAARAPFLVRWSTEAVVLEVPAHEDLPMLRADGRVAVEPLLALLDSLTSDGGPVALLLLSDGHLAAADVSAFRAWLRRHPNVSVRAIAVGPDAVTTTLARLSSAVDVGERRSSETAVAGSRGWFPPEEILCALEAWPLSGPAPLPERVAEVVGEGQGTRT
ncbi:hypothetical protein [Corallococcus sp. RDP092CA]|uniref:hypothetical protein n=1 Tax=Corallococcus sp. RDP092CA TaxID=3109369 RepID=UPI0035B40C3B